MAVTQSIGRVSIILQGDYSATTTYNKLDIVSYQGSSYCAKQTTVGNLPTNETYWQKIAEKGAKGDTGATGETGSTGATGKGISYISKTSSEGATDTYTITFTDGTTTDFTVTNGTGNDWDDVRYKPFASLDSSDFQVVGNVLKLVSKPVDAYTKQQTDTKLAEKISNPAATVAEGYAPLSDGEGGVVWSEVETESLVQSVNTNQLAVSSAGQLAFNQATEIKVDKVGHLGDILLKIYDKTVTYVTGDFVAYNGEVWELTEEGMELKGMPPSDTYWTKRSLDNLAAVTQKLSNQEAIEKSIIGGDAWDNTRTNDYAVGDTCIDDNKVYVCVKSDGSKSTRPSTDTEGTIWKKTSLSEVKKSLDDKANAVLFTKRLTIKSISGVTADISVNLPYDGWYNLYVENSAAIKLSTGNVVQCSSGSVNRSMMYFKKGQELKMSGSASSSNASIFYHY